MSGGTLRLSLEEYNRVAKKRVVKTPPPLAAYYALGRMKGGRMNRTEQRYAQHLELLRHGKEIIWFKFEAMKFRLADRTWYTPDFCVVTAAGVCECHEVKGYMMEDAAVKIKTAADIYPFRFKLIKARRVRDGGGFTVKDIPGG